MRKIKPWVRGPLELIRHADGHLHNDSDFDRRMALISYDNAIEVAIATFLGLEPRQRSGLKIPQNTVSECRNSYYKKLEFLDDHMRSTGSGTDLKSDEIMFIHKLRNELYHSGNGLVPEEQYVCEARTAALAVCSILFKEDAELMLSETSSLVEGAPSEARGRLSGQVRFLHSFIEFERAIEAALIVFGVPDTDRRTIRDRKLWDMFVREVGTVSGGMSNIVAHSYRVRNAIVKDRPVSLTDKELVTLAGELADVTTFVRDYALSDNIGPALWSRYHEWMRPEINSVRIIQKSRAVYVEIAQRRGTDEHLTRTNLDFINTGNNIAMFPVTATAVENARRFVDDLDPYSIIMAGMDLFTADGCSEIARLEEGGFSKHDPRFVAFDES